MAHGGHYIEKASCGHVLAQCRCMAKDKPVVVRPYPCEACKRAGSAGAVEPVVPLPEA